MAKKSRAVRSTAEAKTVSLAFTKAELKQLTLTSKALPGSVALCHCDNYYTQGGKRSTVKCDCDKE